MAFVRRERWLWCLGCGVGWKKTGYRQVCGGEAFKNERRQPYHDCQLSFVFCHLLIRFFLFSASFFYQTSATLPHKSRTHGKNARGLKHILGDRLKTFTQQSTPVVRISPQTFDFKNDFRSQKFYIEPHNDDYNELIRIHVRYFTG